jgi:hypothetical protein
LRAADVQQGCAMTGDTPPPVLTLEAINDTDAAEPWEASLSLPLPKNPTLELLDAARNDILDYLDYASGVLPELTGPDRVCLEITRAAERLAEIAIERAAAILAERLQRGFSDAALDHHLAARG